MAVPAKNRDLHGNVPDNSSAALVLVDVINDFEFEGAERLLGPALAVADAIAELKRKAKQSGMPVIYVNDNFGKWQSDFRKLLDHCLNEQVRGCEIARLLVPDDDDYFVLKPKHSAFYSTTLDVLLDYLGAKTLVLAGFAGNICVLFTANDAYLRDFHLFVPGDCIASESEEENHYALQQMAKVLKADIRKSTELEFSNREGMDE